MTCVLLGLVLSGISILSPNIFSDLKRDKKGGIERDIEGDRFKMVRDDFLGIRLCLGQGWVSARSV